MGIRTLLKEKREELLRIAAKHGARNLRIFGSVARGEADEKSDVDLVFDLEPGRSLLDHAALLIELEQLLGVKVDAFTERGLRERVRKNALKETIPL